jgi:hypothetical protein
MRRSRGAGSASTVRKGLEIEGDRDATCPACLRNERADRRYLLEQAAVVRLHDDDLRRIARADDAALDAALGLLPGREAGRQPS